LYILLIIKYNKRFQKKIILENSFNISINNTQKNLSFNVINPELYYSKKFDIMKFSYQVEVFDFKNNLILPSDLTLYYNLHIICFIKINNTININSFPSIERNKYFKCIEIVKLNERIKFGIIFYETENNGTINNDYAPYYISTNLFNYYCENDTMFDSLKINNEYLILKNPMKYKYSPQKLKKLYVSHPFFNLRRNLFKKENQWNFINIFNDYYCSCKGFNCMNLISRNCKYFFYIYLIDINRNIYKKNDYLLIDFIFKRYSSDDVFPIFEGMINKKINVHYLTEKEEIYNKYCKINNYCDVVLQADEKNYKINDDFLEKHLTLILKLKYVISSVGVDIDFINNLFYNVDYITYICVGHGISFFKYYLYEKYYGVQNFDKLLIPNSYKLIHIPLKYGWKYENIIKLNLPRWDKYNNVNKSSIGFENTQSQSIFIMFTWRELEKDKNISSYYIKNIFRLLNNRKLINNILKHNLTLYFTLHHQLLKYKNKFKDINSIKYIEENDIADCLSKTNLLLSDYSSIIFDMIYRQRPYIIFIPDANDPNINKLYKKNTYDIINKFKVNSFQFENIYFDINSTVDKINYYIENKFKLDLKLKKFYEDFNFTHENSTNRFINHLISL